LLTRAEIYGCVSFPPKLNKLCHFDISEQSARCRSAFCVLLWLTYLWPEVNLHSIEFEFIPGRLSYVFLHLRQDRVLRVHPLAHPPKLDCAGRLIHLARQDLHGCLHQADAERLMIKLIIAYKYASRYPISSMMIQRQLAMLSNRCVNEVAFAGPSVISAPDIPADFSMLLPAHNYVRH
ncbi:MAG: hypothetical protein GY847_34360, partial [Proteobacteria bacterium]|nr:hypothetical protein [Pseudomonadota bacterium]